MPYEIQVDGADYKVSVFEATSYDHPNTWGMVINRVSDGAQRLVSYPKDESWRNARFYNVVLWADGGRIGHPRSLDDTIRMAFSPEAG